MKRNTFTLLLAIILVGMTDADNRGGCVGIADTPSFILSQTKRLYQKGRSSASFEAFI